MKELAVACRPEPLQHARQKVEPPLDQPFRSKVSVMSSPRQKLPSRAPGTRAVDGPRADVDEGGDRRTGVGGVSRTS